MDKVDFSSWEKINLVVAQIKNVDDVPGADKLYKLTLDVGHYGERTICAGIKQHYSKEELIGKKIIYFENLMPRKLKGVESQGMLLAATDKDHSKVILIVPDKNAENGWKIS